MRSKLLVSVVIPTCNRRDSLERLLDSLAQSHGSLAEVIVVDSSDQYPTMSFDKWPTLKVLYLRSEKSVCMQRNFGIQQAKSEWVFLCDDDIEVPKEYLPGLIEHISSHPHAGAVTGIVLQKEGEVWKSEYPLVTQSGLVMNQIFGLGMWGDIQVRGMFAKRARSLGNRVTRAGWPVIISLSGQIVRTPIYGLGAAMVRKDWLLKSPYDEVLDPSGIGDNYGVAMGFPDDIIVVPGLHVFHHRSEVNRTDPALSYYRRILALGYFISIGLKKSHVSTGMYTWSLIGNLLMMAKRGEMKKFKATWRALLFSLMGNNPYLLGRKMNLKRVAPVL